MTDNERKLISIFDEISNNKDGIAVNLETKISDLALDSMDVLDVIMQIERELGVNIPIAQFSLCKNIMDINKELINAKK
jgi:acyl carrier protein